MLVGHILCLLMVDFELVPEEVHSERSLRFFLASKGNQGVDCRDSH